METGISEVKNPKRGTFSRENHKKIPGISEKFLGLISSLCSVTNCAVTERRTRVALKTLR